MITVTEHWKGQTHYDKQTGGILKSLVILESIFFFSYSSDGTTVRPPPRLPHAIVGKSIELACLSRRAVQKKDGERCVRDMFSMSSSGTYVWLHLAFA